MVAVHEKEGYQQLNLMHTLLKKHELLHMTMSNLVIDIKDLLSLSKLVPSHLSDHKENVIQNKLII
jgi:hypothetical protein